MATRKSQTSHDQMVWDVYNHLISNSYRDVKADLQSLTKPDLIHWTSNKKGHIPDLTAKYNGNEFIFEVETTDSIFDQHTEDQWRLFAANANQYGKSFRVVVPKSSKEAVDSRLNQLGIQADIWTVG